MSTYKFKTTINCAGCVSKVSPFLNEGNTIEHWEVDINNPDKILTVETTLLSSDEIIERVKKSGFNIGQI